MVLSKLNIHRHDFSSLEGLQLDRPSTVRACASAAQLAGDLPSLKNHTYEC